MKTNFGLDKHGISYRSFKEFENTDALDFSKYVQSNDYEFGYIIEYHLIDKDRAKKFFRNFGYRYLAIWNDNNYKILQIFYADEDL